MGGAFRDVAMSVDAGGLQSFYGFRHALWILLASAADKDAAHLILALYVLRSVSAT